MNITPEEYTFLEKFGLKITLLREGQGLSQQQLAESAGVDIEMLLQIECGTIDIPLYDMHRLHTALGIETSVFFTDFN
jgi:transcriptional regulator with XRE-family HTH domain